MKAGTHVRIRDLSAYRGRAGVLIQDFGFWSNMRGGRYTVRVGDEIVHCTKIAATAPTVAPGWYPYSDGSGTLRYWDGQQWTQHTAEPPPMNT